MNFYLYDKEREIEDLVREYGGEAVLQLVRQVVDRVERPYVGTFEAVKHAKKYNPDLLKDLFRNAIEFGWRT